MPRIPKAQTKVGLNPLRLSPLSAPNVPISSSLDRATEKLAGGLDKVQEYLQGKQEQEDVQNLIETESAYKLAIVEKTRGLGQRKGRDAAGSLNEFNVFHEGLTLEEESFEEFDNEPDSVTAFKTKYFNLNGSLRQKFDNVMAAHLPASLSSIGKYEDGQTLLANQGIFKTAVESAIAMASVNPNDQLTINQQKQRISASAEGMGRLMGSNREAIDLTKQKNISALHVRVFNELLVKENPETAREYLKANRAEFFGKASTVADKALKPVLTKSRALVKTREIMLLPEEKQDAAYFKINDPEVQEQTRLYVEQRQASIKEARLADEKEAEESITAEILKRTPWESISQELLNRIPPTRQAVLRNASIKSFEGVEVKTNMASYAELSRMTEQEFMKVNIPLDFPDNLSRADSKYWIDQQNKIRNAPDKSILTHKEISNALTKNLGGEGFDVNGIEGEAKRKINQAVLSEEEVKQRKLTVAEFEDTARKVMTPGFTVSLLDKYREKVDPAVDTFTVTQQLNTAFEVNELTGVDNAKKRGLIKTRVEKIIQDRETQTGKRLRDDERALIIQGAVEDKVMVPGALFGSNEKLVVESTEEEILKGHVMVKTDESKLKVEMSDLEDMDPKLQRSILTELKQAGEPATRTNIATVLVRRNKAVALKAKLAAEKAEKEFLKANSKNGKPIVRPKSRTVSIPKGKVKKAAVKSGRGDGKVFVAPDGGKINRTDFKKLMHKQQAGSLLASKERIVREFGRVAWEIVEEVIREKARDLK